MKNLLHCMLGVLIVLIYACAPPRLDAPGDRGDLKPLFKGDPSMVLAWHPGARMLAIANGGLEIYDLNNGTRTRLSNEGGDAVAWLPDGTGLVVSRYKSGKSGLRIHLLDGSKSTETLVEGRVVSLMPKGKTEILAGILAVTEFRFGINIASRLAVWDTRTEPVVISFDENTIHPGVWQAMRTRIEAGSFFILSPWRDEVFFSAFHDPPAFPPYFRLAVMNIASGAVRQIGQVPPSLSGGAYVSNGDAVMYGSLDGIKTVEEWDGAEIAGYPFGGSCFSASFDGSCLAVDGRLFLNGEKPADFSPDGRVTFSPQGREAIVTKDGWAYLLAGLQTDLKVELPDLDREEIVRLRKWRALGMITQEEYLGYRTRVERND